MQHDDIMLYFSDILVYVSVVLCFLLFFLIKVIIVRCCNLWIICCI